MSEAAHGEVAELVPVVAEPIPAFAGTLPVDLREQMTKAVKAWMLRTPSPHTRRAYQSDLDQFLAHAGIRPGPGSSSPLYGPRTCRTGATPWRPTNRPTAPSAAK